MIRNLPSNQLLKLMGTYTRAWQAMGDAFFPAFEKRYGIDIAIEMDTEE